MVVHNIYFIVWYKFINVYFFTAITFTKNCSSLSIFPYNKQFKLLNISTKLKHLPLTKLLFRIKQKQYSIFQQKDIVYCYKGLIGRIAPIVVHASMILILLGAVFGSLNGFKAQEIIPKTETFHIQNILTNGQLTTIPKVSARVNDFWITYTKQTTVSQFYSDISILNVDGNEIERKTIFVNSPVKYQGVDYYQTDWNLIGLRIKTDKDPIPVQYPLVSILNNKQKVWITWIPSDSTFTKWCNYSYR